jgi:hypothetical protein
MTLVVPLLHPGAGCSNAAAIPGAHGTVTTSESHSSAGGAGVVSGVTNGAPGVSGSSATGGAGGQASVADSAADAAADSPSGCWVGGVFHAEGTSWCEPLVDASTATLCKDPAANGNVLVCENLGCTGGWVMDFYWGEELSCDGDAGD